MASKTKQAFRLKEQQISGAKSSKGFSEMIRLDGPSIVVLTCDTGYKKVSITIILSNIVNINITEIQL